jgi:DNA helicase-2/ATP-dependent DNA helicase PcrA
MLWINSSKTHFLRVLYPAFSDPGRLPRMPELADHIFEGLTEPQQAAVGHVNGPLLVLAGPGSGKTTVVTRRVANLIHQGVPAWEILALTFTNKAAEEMRDRIERRLPADLPGRRGLTVATFHAFCARLLRRYAESAGIASSYSIYDAADQRDAVKQAIKRADLSERNFTPASIAAQISNAKNQLLSCDEFDAQATDYYARNIARAYRAYARILKDNDALDFDDLLLVTARLLQTNDRVREELQQRYQYLLIDEYQDTNHAQFVIADALGSAHRNVCVVGDPDQSIYGWRGADIRNILDFEQRYPEATVIPLGQNFRSTGHIVAAADALIRNNKQRKHKPLHTELEDGEPLTVTTSSDERREAATVLEHIVRLHRDDDVPYREMAVLYRVNALSRVMEEAFRNAQVPYVIARGAAFYERKEIKDALSYLRLIANPSDEVALRRIINTPARGIGRTSLDRVAAFGAARNLRFADALRGAEQVPNLTARAVKSIGAFIAMVDGWRALDTGDEDSPPGPGNAPTALAQLVERVIRESKLEHMYNQSRSEEDMERLENLEELVSAAAQFEPRIDVDEESGETESEPESMSLPDRLRAFLESVALVSDADAIDPARGAVTLMTLHAAKGLEFDVIAMIGLEEGLLPHSRAAQSDDELEEERRLCFVGVTRARRHLLVSRAVQRTHRGLRERTIESRFLDELPVEHIRQVDSADEDDFLDGGESSYVPSFSLGSSGASLRETWPRGCLVRHPTFGLGRIESITPRAAGSSARIIFQAVGRKTLILEYARLERVDEDELDMLG